MVVSSDLFLLYCRKKRVVIDTGILLVLLKYRNKQKLSEKELKVVEDVELFIRHKTKNITAHVLAETSNLCKKRIGRYLFKASREYLVQFAEIVLDRTEILNHNKIDEFGVTDIGLVKLLSKDSVLITSDAPLYYYCMTRRIAAVRVEL